MNFLTSRKEMSEILYQKHVKYQSSSFIRARLQLEIIKKTLKKFLLPLAAAGGDFEASRFEMKKHTKGDEGNLFIT